MAENLKEKPPEIPNDSRTYRDVLERIEGGYAGPIYANDIFSLGQEMMDTIEGRPTGSPMRLRVGIADVLAKIDANLADAGTDKSRILAATVYLADIDLKDEMNAAWMEWVDKDNLPTRTAVGVALTPGTLVEITITAAR